MKVNLTLKIPILFASFAAWGAPQALATCPPPTDDGPPLEERVECAIEHGIDWLASVQNVDGSFPGSHPLAKAGLACVKFADRARELNLDPFNPEEYEYSVNLMNAIDYLGRHITQEASGEMHFGHTYYTSIALMCFSSTRDGDREVKIPYGGGSVMKLYSDVVKGLFDWLIRSQWGVTPPVTDWREGGWGYDYNNHDPDNSNSGYATLALGFAVAYFDMIIPDKTIDHLKKWVVAMQIDPGDFYYTTDRDGASLYTATTSSYINILKTGNLLYELGMIGQAVGDDRVDRAIAYIERKWTAPDDVGWNNWDDGGRTHYQSTYMMMKGLDSLGKELLASVPPEGGDWFAEVSEHIIAEQEDNGRWLTDRWGDAYLATLWALLTLEKSVPPFVIEVPFDIKPTSCRNPLNIKKQGVLPAALLGTQDFHVDDVDPESLKLCLKEEDAEPEEEEEEPPPACVMPIRFRFNYEDVASPYEPYIGKEDAYDCTTEGPDGELDLTMKFDAPEVVSVLGLDEMADGDVVVLQIHGNLLTESGEPGTPLVGEDVIVILKKGKAKKKKKNIFGV